MKTKTLPVFLLTAAFMQFSGTAWAGSFDAELASCAKTSEFCDKVSYDKKLCDKTKKKLPDCDSNTGAGVLCKLQLKDIAPTQVSVGAHATHCKAKAIQPIPAWVRPA
jgi:hypothetical protein